jgi:hypothetical protein
MEEDKQKLRLVASQPAPVPPSRLPFIKRLAAEILRDLTKATATQSPDDGVVRSIPAVKQLVEELQTTDEAIRYWDVLLAAVNSLRPDYRPDCSEMDRALVSVARHGLLYFTELSATDNASNGRLAKRRSGLLGAIHYVEELENQIQRETREALRNTNPKRKGTKKGAGKRRIFL